MPATILVNLSFPLRDLVHGALNDLHLLLRGKLHEVLLGGQFDVGAEPIRKCAGALHERRRCTGNCL